MPWYPGTMRSRDACMKANSRMDVCSGVSPMDQQAFEATRRLEPGGRSGNSDIDIRRLKEQITMEGTALVRLNALRHLFLQLAAVVDAQWFCCVYEIAMLNTAY